MDRRRPLLVQRATVPCITHAGPGQDCRRTGHPRRKGPSMRLPTSATDARHEDILELEPLLRRVVGARVRDPDTVDDLVQEALARVIAVRGRLDDEAVTPYAIVTARNLVTSLARERERSRRHQPRLVDLNEPERPEDAALRNEEAAAVEAALAGLPDHEREVVVAHEVEGVDTATLAEARRSTPGAVGTQLARTRARLRLDYLLALRRVELPTPRCRPVLLALSAGDRRRQLALDAGGHLMQCPTCASLSRPLVERRRSIAVLLPLLALWWLWRRIQAWASRRPVLASLTAVSVVTVAGLVLVPPLVDRDQAPQPAPTTTTLPPSAAAPGQAGPGGGGGPGVRLVVPGRSLLPVPGREVLARHAGQPVRGVNVPARGVYADEGFWIGTAAATSSGCAWSAGASRRSGCGRGCGRPSPGGWSPTRRGSPSRSGWCQPRARPWSSARATTSRSPTTTSTWNPDPVRPVDGQETLDLGRPAGVDLGDVRGRGPLVQGDDLAESLILVLEEVLAGRGPGLPLVVGVDLDVPGHPIAHHCLRSCRERRTGTGRRLFRPAMFHVEHCGKPSRG